MKKVMLICTVMASLLMVPGCGVDTSNFIGEDQAKEIALKEAGVTADDVTFVQVKLDNDNGVWKYDVEFSQEYIEYDIDIKAEDGTVLSFEID